MSNRVKAFLKSCCCCCPGLKDKSVLDSSHPGDDDKDEPSPDTTKKAPGNKKTITWGSITKIPAPESQVPLTNEEIAQASDFLENILLEAKRQSNLVNELDAW